MNWQRIKFKCNKCGQESWMEIDLDTYMVKFNDLTCDDCVPVEEA